MAEQPSPGPWPEDAHGGPAGRSRASYRGHAGGCSAGNSLLVLPESELRNALFSLALVSVQGPWIRAVRSEYLQENPQPLWSGGSVRRGARYVPLGTFKSIHLTSDPVTARLEVEAVIRKAEGDLVAVSSLSWKLLRV